MNVSRDIQVYEILHVLQMCLRQDYNNTFEWEGYSNGLCVIGNNTSRVQDSKVVCHLALRYRIYTINVPEQCQNLLRMWQVQSVDVKLTVIKILWVL